MKNYDKKYFRNFFKVYNKLSNDEKAYLSILCNVNNGELYVGLDNSLLFYNYTLTLKKQRKFIKWADIYYLEFLEQLKYDRKPLYINRLGGVI